MFVYGFGELIEQVTALRVEMRQAAEKATAGNSKLDLHAVAASISPSSPSGKWTCSKCGEVNGASDRFCKSCGNYK